MIGIIISENVDNYGRPLTPIPTITIILIFNLIPNNTVKDTGHIKSKEAIKVLQTKES